MHASPRISRRSARANCKTYRCREPRRRAAQCTKAEAGSRAARLLPSSLVRKTLFSPISLRIHRQSVQVPRLPISKWRPWQVFAVLFRGVLLRLGGCSLLSDGFHGKICFVSALRKIPSRRERIRAGGLNHLEQTAGFTDAAGGFHSKTGE